METTDLKVEKVTTDETINEPISLPKIKWEWQEDDSVVVEAIKAKVTAKINEQFRVGFNALQTLYLQARIPELDDFGNPVVVNGEIMWKRHKDGSVVENWATVPIEALDAFVLNASVFNVYAGQNVIDSNLEAAFAKYAYEDAFNDSLTGINKGTVATKDAIASLKSAEDRYFAMYKAYYFKRASDIVDRLDNLVRRVEKVRDMKAKDASREITNSYRQ